MGLHISQDWGRVSKSSRDCENADVVQCRGEGAEGKHPSHLLHARKEESPPRIALACQVTRNCIQPLSNFITVWESWVKANTGNITATIEIATISYPSSWCMYRYTSNPSNSRLPFSPSFLRLVSWGPKSVLRAQKPRYRNQIPKKTYEF